MWGCDWNSTPDINPFWWTALELEFWIFMVEMGYVCFPISAYVLNYFILHSWEGNVTVVIESIEVGYQGSIEAH